MDYYQEMADDLHELFCDYNLLNDTGDAYFPEEETAAYLRDKLEKRIDPYWRQEYELLEARRNLERDCYDATNLYKAIMCGANQVKLNRRDVGYLDEDSTIITLGDVEGFTPEQLRKIKVKFDRLGTDEDGYTVALFNTVKEQTDV